MIHSTACFVGTVFPIILWYHNRFIVHVFILVVGLMMCGCWIWHRWDGVVQILEAKNLQEDLVILR